MTIETRPETQASDECVMTIRLRLNSGRLKLTEKEWDRIIYARLDGLDDVDISRIEVKLI